jgi:F0F1-type ATP synthase assembly protein I
MAAKQRGHAAAELFADTKKQVQRHPIETVAATFAAGIGTGAVIGWVMRHRHRCNCADAREKD